MQPPEADLPQTFLRMLAGKWTTAAIAAAAELGLADALGEAAMDECALAEQLGCDAQGLGRLLAVLAAEGLLTVDAHGAYALTPLGAQLRSDGLRDLARYMGAPFTWTPFAHVADALRIGHSAFERAHGESIFKYLDQHPEDAALYHRGVNAFTRREAAALAEAFDFSPFNVVADLGGGLGTLLVEVLARYPRLRGLLFDRASVIAQAESALGQSPYRERIELRAGDFFESIPEGADVYVLKHVLHNWDDEHALRLLQNCAERLPSAGKLIIVDGYLLPSGMRDGVRLLDLEMFVLCGAGRERRKPEFRALLQRAGLRLESSQPLAGSTCMLVVSRR